LRVNDYQTDLLFGDGAEDLFNRGDAACGLVEAVLKHREHSLFLRLRLYRVARALAEHNLSYSRRRGEHFVDADAALVSVRAFRRLHRPIERNVVQRSTRLYQLFVPKRLEGVVEFFVARDLLAHRLIHRVCLLAIAELAHQPLAPMSMRRGMAPAALLV